MVDYYKPASKGQLMWVAGPEKDFDKPKWWQPRTISTEPAAELDEEDPTLGNQEELAPSKKTKVVRQLECTWILASGQDGLYDHLRHSNHREYAQRLQTEHIVISPCEFRDVNQWNSCLGRLLKFKELEVDVMEVTMLLFDENGLNSFEECSIFDEDKVWRDYEIDEAFEAAHAKKAVFSFTLEPGQPPSTVRFVMPPGFRTIVEQLAPTDTQPRAPEIIVAPEETPASTTLTPSSRESLSDTIQWYHVHLRSQVEASAADYPTTFPLQHSTAWDSRPEERPSNAISASDLLDLRSAISERAEFSQVALDDSGSQMTMSDWDTTGAVLHGPPIDADAARFLEDWRLSHGKYHSE
jgi:hypothetical protein